MTQPTPCPICRKSGNWLAGKFGLFCSERCKMVDLGRWLGEEYRIEAPLRPDDFAEFEQLEGGKELDLPDDSAHR